MAEKVWTAGELEAMTPTDLAAVFESSLITDPALVPDTFLDRVRSRACRRIADTETRKQ